MKAIEWVWLWNTQMRGSMQKTHWKLRWPRNMPKKKTNSEWLTLSYCAMHFKSVIDIHQRNGYDHWREEKKRKRMVTLRFCTTWDHSSSFEFKVLYMFVKSYRWMGCARVKNAFELKNCFYSDGKSSKFHFNHPNLQNVFIVNSSFFFYYGMHSITSDIESAEFREDTTGSHSISNKWNIK